MSSLIKSIIDEFKDKLYIKDKKDLVNLKKQIFSSADFALVASGTVTLELAAYNIPMVVGYDVNWISGR